MRLKIRWKIMVLGFVMLLVTVTLLAGAVGWVFVSQARIDVAQYEEDQINQRKQHLKNVLDLAFTAINEVYREGNPIGKKGGTPDVRARLLNMVKHMRFGKDKSEYFWIHSYNPKNLSSVDMVMHPTVPELDGKDISHYKYTDGKHIGKVVYATGISENVPFFQQMNRVVHKNGQGYVSYDWPKPTKDGLTTHQPKISFVRLHKDLKWVVGIGTYISDIVREKRIRQAQVYAQLKKAGAVLGIGSLILLLAASISIFMLSSMITKPINDNIGFLKSIAEGKGDLTKRLEVLSKDETAELATWFNLFVSQIQEIVKNIANRSDIIGKGTVELNESIDNVVKTANRLTHLMTNQMQTVKATSSTINSISSSIQETADYSVTATDIVKETIDETRKGITAIKSMGENMEKIMLAGNQINDFLGIITDIAHQTNVLSINARIEASKAGEQGKGFAVVSERIRQLSEKTTVAADQIQKTIEENNKVIASGRESVSAVDSYFSYIKDKMGENDAISSKIFDSNSRQKSSILSLQETLAELRTTADEISKISKSIDETTEKQLDISSNTFEQTEELISQIKQFKYD